MTTKTDTASTAPIAVVTLADGKERSITFDLATLCRIDDRTGMGPFAIARELQRLAPPARILDGRRLTDEELDALSDEEAEKLREANRLTRDPAEAEEAVGNFRLGFAVKFVGACVDLPDAEILKMRPGALVDATLALMPAFGDALASLTREHDPDPTPAAPTT